MDHSVWAGGKGGRSREMPILKDSQRELLDEAGWLAGHGRPLPKSG